MHSYYKYVRFTGLCLPTSTAQTLWVKLDPRCWLARSINDSASQQRAECENRQAERAGAKDGSP
jgi:hypothetical protein